jgi:hypothetical protein
MIHSNSFLTAAPFSAVLANNGFTLVAKPGTVLGELVRMSVPVQDSTLTEEVKAATVFDETAAMNSEAIFVEYDSKGSDNMPSQHTLEMGAFITDIGKAVTPHISYAKNVVRPMVLEFAEKVTEYMENKRPREASQDYNIVTLKTPSILTDESFLDSLTNYKDKSILTPDSNLSFGTKSKEELLAMVMLGHARTDKMITEWVTNKPDDFLETVWNVFFTKESVQRSLNGVHGYEDVAKLNAFERADYALAIFLLANKATNDIQESSLSLTAYKTLCLQYVEYAATTLVGCLKNIVTHARTNTLVISNDTMFKTVKVNGDLYSDWLAKGGSPEIILGLSIADTGDKSISAIDAKAADYLRQWNSYCSFYRTRENNNRFEYLKTFLHSEFLQSLINKDDLEKDYMLKNPSYNERVEILLNETLNSLTNKDFDDVYSLALTFVGKVRFYYNASYQFLTDMNQAGKDNPNIDAREAATIAAINYIADYAADQIVAVKD